MRSVGAGDVDEGWGWSRHGRRGRHAVEKYVGE